MQRVVAAQQVAATSGHPCPDPFARGVAVKLGASATLQPDCLRTESSVASDHWWDDDLDPAVALCRMTNEA